MIEKVLLCITVGTLGLLSPGPDFFLILRNAVRYTFKTAVMTALGITAGITIHIALNLFGLAYVLKTSPWLFEALNLLGGAYLIYIGVKGLLSAKSSAKPSTTQQGKIESPLEAFREGFFTNILNPKCGLFFFGIFTQIMGPLMPFWQKSSLALIFVLQSLIYWPLLVYLFKQRHVEKLLLRYSTLISGALSLILIAMGLRIALTIPALLSFMQL